MQKQILTTIDGITSGDPATMAQSHPLGGPLKGWTATKASRGHRIIHRPNDAGGIHVGYVGLHEYDKAIQRLTSLEEPETKTFQRQDRAYHVTSDKGLEGIKANGVQPGFDGNIHVTTDIQDAMHLRHGFGQHIFQVVIPAGTEYHDHFAGGGSHKVIHGDSLPGLGTLKAYGPIPPEALPERTGSLTSFTLLEY